MCRGLLLEWETGVLGHHMVCTVKTATICISIPGFRSYGIKGSKANILKYCLQLGGPAYVLSVTYLQLGDPAYVSQLPATSVLKVVMGLSCNCLDLGWLHDPKLKVMMETCSIV